MYHTAAKRGDIPKPRALASQATQNQDNSIVVWTLVVAILFSSILCVWSRAKVISLGYEMSRETRRLVELKDVNEKLKAELAMLKAPGRLEAIARDRLDLNPPRNNQIVLLK